MSTRRKKGKIDLTVSEQLRQAITESGLSIYAISKGSGVTQPVVARFTSGERDIRMATADKLFKFFGMVATPPTRGPSGSAEG